MAAWHRHRPCLRVQLGFTKKQTSSCGVTHKRKPNFELVLLVPQQQHASTRGSSEQPGKTREAPVYNPWDPCHCKALHMEALKQLPQLHIPTLNTTTFGVTMSATLDVHWASLSQQVWQRILGHAAGPDSSDECSCGRDRGFRGQRRRWRTAGSLRTVCKAFRDAMDGAVTDLQVRRQAATPPPWRGASLLGPRTLGVAGART